jgi:poly(ADP-ribose) glycohydrolase
LVKIRFLLHYFERVTQQMPTGTVSFNRRSLRRDQQPNWKQPIPIVSLPVKLLRDFAIEKCADVRLQVDFAHKRIGGKVLGNGCVQEEIRFTVWPELIVSCLFTEVMLDRECVFMTGAEQFSEYSGYKDKFTFERDVQDSCARDSLNRRQVCVVAIDALSFFRRKTAQFTDQCLIRELNKAYAGFARQDALESSNATVDPCSCESAKVKRTLNVDHCGGDSDVATGNWGCGVYMGDDEYKFTIQLMAGAHAGRPMQFVMFDKKNLPDRIESFLDKVKERDFNAKDLMLRMVNYNKHVAKAKKKRMSFFEFVFRPYEELE